MRIILIVQSLIILAGAYYVYTLTRPPVPSTETNTSATVSEVEGQVAPTDDQSEVDTQTVEEIATPASGVGIEGYNDVGMEFPIPDDEVMLEVR